MRGKASTLTGPRVRAPQKQWPARQPAAPDYPGEPPSARDQSVTAESRESVENWARAFCTAVFDIEAGRRDARSLRRWMALDLFNNFARRINAKAAPTGGSIPATAVSSRLWPVGPGVNEVACTVWDRGQLRGIAVRVEELRGRPVAVALEYG